ncbi:MAG: type IV secretion system DNA-binding domain-containing protein [Candidatus Gracilibacteria bacterium]|jgi:hypothetical protein
MAKLKEILEMVLGSLKVALEAVSAHWDWIIFWLVLALLFNRLLPWALRQFYEHWTARKRVFIQVTMPREESQKDKENATEKDFKERIGIMEQLYRAVHEIRELDLGNRFMVWMFKRDTVSFEIHARHKDITFYISMHPYYAGILEKQITAFYPSASIDFIRPEGLKAKDFKGKITMKGYYLYLKKLNWYPLKTYKTIENDSLNDFTNVLSKLDENDRAVIQIMIQPRHEKWQKEARAFATMLFKNKKPGNSGFFGKIVGALGWIFRATVFGYDSAEKNSHPPGSSSGDSYVRMLQTDEEVAKRIGEKSNQVGFDSIVRIMASSDKGEAQCDGILNGLFVAFNVTKDAASNWFQARRFLPFDSINSPILNDSLETRSFQFGEKMSILTPEELASIFHFPSSRYNYTPVIKWLSYKVLPAPTDLPTEGILLGHNVYRGVKREVHFKRKDRTRHHYIIGQTGTGKSAFISYMARQDIANGDGVCVVDPHGDLIEEILQFIPKERAKDVIIFDPSDTERPMGLNMLEAKTPEQQDMASSQATEIFIKIFGDEIFGPRIQHYFRNACLTLMEDPDEGATLIDVPRIFVDDAFMRYKVSKVKNPVVKSFWEHEYASTGDRERQEMIPYFSAKFGPFITNSIMRNTIGQAKSGFNIREVMDNQKILLVNLSKGKLGGLNTQLLGLVLVAQIQQAAMSRVDLPEEQRKDFYLYVDEFQNFATDTFCSILSEARKYRLCLIMAHQYIGQLTVSKFGQTSTQIRDAVFGNVGTLQSFKIGAEDAEYLAKEYAPVLTEQDVIGIANYKAYMKLNINSAASRPFSLETIWDQSKANPKVRDIVKQYSRMKYGRKKSFVEQEIGARIGIDINTLGDEVKPDYTAEVNPPVTPPTTPSNGPV